jgi:hypothetical protein
MSSTKCLGVNKVTCCKSLVDGVMQPLPFRRVLVTDYYDGPTEGLAECSECKKAFAFRKLDWDHMQNVRITGFAPLQIRLNEIAARLSMQIDIKEVVLVPPLGSTTLNQFADELLDQSPRYIAAIEGAWPGQSRIWRTISGFDVGNLIDWFSFLGIPRERSEW